MPRKREQREKDSPEIQVLPYDDLNTRQEKITGETFPDIVLEICDSCKWCATCINERGIQLTCPICQMRTSMIPMAVDEMCILERDEKRGITLRFVRKLPLR
jgi:hypothetical protein